MTRKVCHWQKSFVPGIKICHGQKGLSREKDQFDMRSFMRCNYEKKKLS